MLLFWRSASVTSAINKWLVLLVYLMCRLGFKEQLAAMKTGSLAFQNTQLLDPIIAMRGFHPDGPVRAICS